MNRLKTDSDSVASSLDRAAAVLGAAGVERPRRDARILLAEALGGRPELVTGYPERLLDPGQASRFRALVGRRAAREPVSRILGRREFWSLDLCISADVLDPRPESETVVEAVLGRIGDRAAPVRILDLGTGSGCLLLALLSELPRARGLGVDISPAALAIARENARRLGLSPRTAFRLGSWAQGLTGSWQVIVSNPPYIMDHEIADLAPEVARYDPRLALSGGADGLAAYRSLAPQVARLLASNGILAFEVGAGQAGEVGQLLGAAGLTGVACMRDLGAVERCVLATRGAALGTDLIGGMKKTVGKRRIHD
jgi:release factor glutamine methyltransferase